MTTRMLENFLDKLKGLLFNPVETFQKSREDTLGTAFAYYIVLAIVNSILITLLFSAVASLTPLAMLPGFTELFSPIVFVVLLVGWIVAPFIGGAWLHLFVWLLGGRKGYIQTVKAVMYAATPSQLLGWIPIVSIIGMIWGLVLEVIGIRELQEISTGRAIAAVILSVVVVLVIIALILAFFLIANVSSGPVPPVPY